MNRIALKMLLGDRSKYFGILFGIAFSALLITESLAVFTGLMTRTYSLISDMGQPDVWVMDPRVRQIDGTNPMQDTDLQRVRSVAGVEWAVPLFKGNIKTGLPNGDFTISTLVGLDDATLLGGPPAMAEGNLSELHRSDGIVVDEISAHTKFARPSAMAGQPKIPLQVGDTLELNDNRAVVVGISRNSPSFVIQPLIYTTYTRARSYAPPERKLLTYVLVKGVSQRSPKNLCAMIRQQTGLAAYTKDEFKLMTLNWYMVETGIPVNFGITVVIGFIVGSVIAGQTFYNFTLDNLRYFGVLKAMGADNLMILQMILLQAVFVSVIGFGLGAGGTALVGILARNTSLAFVMPWSVLGATGIAVTLICMISAVVSLGKLMRLEPATVFRS